VPFLGKEKKKEKDSGSSSQELLTVGEGFNRKKPIYVSEENIHQYVFKTCCHPIPGDDILGFIDGKNHIEIHKRACPVATKLKSSYGNRILDAKWDMHKQIFFDATIVIRGTDRKGMLLDVTDIISSQMNVNICKVNISANEGIFEGYFELRVHDRDDVKEIIGKLKLLDNIEEIQQNV
jgi:GTP pyrophosphokinase